MRSHASLRSVRRQPTRTGDTSARANLNPVTGGRSPVVGGCGASDQAGEQPAALGGRRNVVRARQPRCRQVGRSRAGTRGSDRSATPPTPERTRLSSVRYGAHRGGGGVGAWWWRTQAETRRDPWRSPAAGAEPARSKPPTTQRRQARPRSTTAPIRSSSRRARHLTVSGVSGGRRVGHCPMRRCAHRG